MAWQKLVLMLVLLAGCMANQPVQPDAADSPYDVAPTQTRGIIKGLVVDEAIRPVADAQVLLAPGGQIALTSAGGIFSFQNLEAGPYFVLTTKPGYSTVETSTFVEAGVDPPIVKVQILRDASRQPYVEAHHTALLTGIGACVQDVCRRIILSGTAVGQGANKLSIPLEPTATVAQTEMRWKPNNAYGGYGTNFCVTWTPNEGWVEDRQTTSAMPVITRLNTTNLSTDAKVAKLLECELQVAAGGSPPVGIMFLQASDAYTHIFHFFVPREDWQFGRDGAYPTPS